MIFSYVYIRRALEYRSIPGLFVYPHADTTVRVWPVYVSKNSQNHPFKGI